MKRFQSIGALLSAITIMLVVLLLSVFALAAWRAYDEREAARGVAANVALARQLLDVRAMLRYEATDLTDNAPWKEFLLRRAIEFDPSNPAVVYELGTLLRNLRRDADALELFLRHEQLVPDDYQGLGQIGSCLGDLGRYTEAESYLRRALQFADDAITHYDLAVVLTRMGRVKEAVSEYERALERDPAHVKARTNLAVNLVNLGQVERASRELTRVLAIDPGNASAHTNLGLVFAQQGQVEQAVRELREALRIDPMQVQARTALDVLEK